ncbi:MAG: SpoIIE family protein phosphatase [Clostridia bacterium]|nr:SpoIIE family protein phosphatase [Clostridia bacterium]
MEATTTVKRKNPDDFHFTTLAKEIIIHGIYLVLGVLVSAGAVLGELAPFGASYVAAVPLRYMGTAVVGSALGYIWNSPADSFRYIAVVVAIGALKWLLNDFKKISQSRLFAPLLAFVPMCATGVALLFVSTSRMSELGTCLVEALISSAAAYFIARSAELVSSRTGLGGLTQQEVSCLTVSACILMLSFGSVSILGVSVGRILAVVTVLVCARYGGVTGGSISGIATGVVFSIGSSDMAFLAGGYAFGGLVSGLFAAMGKLPVGAVFTLCSSVLSFASGDNRLVLSLFIECLFATGLFMLIPSDFGSTVRAAFLPAPDKGRSEAMRRSVTMRLSHAAHALEGVTECVGAVSEKLRNKYDNTSELRIYENAAQMTCHSCGLRVYCWDKQKEVTKDDFSRLTETLRQEGFVSDRTIDENFTKKCCKQKELAKSINESYKEYLSSLAAERRITQVRSVVAGQFAGLSDMLEDLSEDFESCEDFDTDSAERIMGELRRQGVVVVDCSCRIDRAKRMTVELELAVNRKTDISRQEIHRTVSKCCGRRFERAVESNAIDRVRMVMSELSAYDVEIGSSQHIAGGGNLCGDCLNYFMNGFGSMVAVISDGMGSGGAAAVDSNMATSVLTKLIKAGISYDCALSVVNSSLMIKSEEESLATLDVADINLFTGKVSLMKAGAPVTYVRKGGRVHRREFPSLPVGILSEVRFSKDVVTLHEGDALLMVSDGAVAADDKWLEDLVRTWQDAPAQDFASIVVNEAIKRRNDGHDDDITAIAIRLVENE